MSKTGRMKNKGKGIVRPNAHRGCGGGGCREGGVKFRIDARAGVCAKERRVTDRGRYRGEREGKGIAV